MDKISKQLQLIAKELIARKSEDQLLKQLKNILDNNSFCKKLSQFYGDDKHKGLWLSGEGDTTIDGEYAVDFYSDSQLHEKLQQFIKKNNLDYEWYDAGTFLIYA